jgi:hypothetical protein
VDVNETFVVEMKTGEWLYLIGALERKYPQANDTIEKFFGQIMRKAYGMWNVSIQEEKQGSGE